MRTLLFVVACVVGLAAAPVQAQVDARLLRHPDVSDTQITFVYGGDVWVAPKSGGTAHRLSSPAGDESFPRFSPDGQTIAFSGNYDGNVDVYTIPTGGGVPTRITHHPGEDRFVDWTPDGASLVYATEMTSGRTRFNQLYRTDASGGLPERLPMEHAEFASFAPDGSRIAFTPETRVFRTWKRYRGGAAPEVWTFDLDDNTARNLSNSPANDELPMWSGSTVYFLSDRGTNQRYNIWAHDLDSGQTRQVTQFTDVDVHFPALGPSEIVFEANGRLHLLDLETEETRTVDVDVVSDRAPVKTRLESVGGDLQDAWISPSGVRAVVQARGELFSLPAEHGVIRPLTRSSGAADRHPAWSPDGEQIAYFSDASGEYELTVRPADGSGAARTVTSLGEGYRYQPHWSPDSESIAFVDHAGRIHVVDVASGAVEEVAQTRWRMHGGLAGFSLSWSPDSRWLAFSIGADNRNDVVHLYDTASDELHAVTSGFYGVSNPVFAPSGDHLFVTTNRNFSPVYSAYDNTFAYPNATHVAALPLRADVPSPLAPRNDEEMADEEDESDEANGDANGDDSPVEIDLDAMEERMVVLPLPAGNYQALAAAEGKVIAHRAPRAGSGDEASPLVYFDLDAREEKTIVSTVQDFVLSADGSKVLLYQNGQLGIVDVAPDQSIQTPLRTSDLEMELDPRAEWEQIFRDAWRLERDYFYDPTLHGVDWDGVRETYGALVDDAASRSDVNFLIGEMIAELNASHTYRGGGDVDEPTERGAGLLGVDWTLENGTYRIDRIVTGAPWTADVRSPLHRPGVDVSEDTYVLAVNGRPLDTDRDPWASFDGLAGETVELTVNDAPTMDGARTVLVDLLSSDEDERLRYLDWVEQKRQRVDDATDGRVGYVYVPNTGVDGQNELVRQFYAQFQKDALIIDERFNSGGQIPDRFIELLNRKPKAFWNTRHTDDWQWPPVAHFGPKTMLINGWSGSGGDAFPDYFRKAELGPLIGTRTWGGLIGISGNPSLIDGGQVTVPTFRMYNADGSWFAEGRGVEPDIRVDNDPTSLAEGGDPQLERAIQEMLDALDRYDPVQPERPPYEDRTAPAASSDG